MVLTGCLPVHLTCVQQINAPIAQLHARCTYIVPSALCRMSTPPEWMELTMPARTALPTAAVRREVALLRSAHGRTTPARHV